MPTKTRIEREKQREKRLKYLNERRKQFNFINTATSTTEPIKPLQIWRYNRNIIMIYGTNRKLYALKGNRKFFLQELHTPINDTEPPDKTYTPQIRYPNQTHLQRYILQNIDKIQNVDKILPLIDTILDDAEHMNIFEKMAKKQGKTPEEIYETEETFKQFMKDIHRLATTN